MNSQTRKLIEDLIQTGSAAIGAAETTQSEFSDDFLAKVRLWAQTGARADAAMGRAPAPAAAAPVFDFSTLLPRLHAIASVVTVYPDTPTRKAQWEPAYEGVEPGHGWAYRQDCGGCGGSFETVDGIAQFCPWCGTAIPEPSGELRWKIVNLDHPMVDLSFVKAETRK